MRFSNNLEKSSTISASIGVLLLANVPSRSKTMSCFSEIDEVIQEEIIDDLGLITYSLTRINQKIYGTYLGSCHYSCRARTVAYSNI